MTSDSSPTASNPRTIAVGVDGSAGAVRAVRWAALEARATGGRLRLVHVWDLPTVLFPAMAGAYLPPEDLADGARQIVAEAADQARRTLDEGDGGDAVAIETQIVQGGPVSGLLAASEDAELLVVGSRGRGGLASLVLGSVAQTCTHHAHLPVVVVGHDVATPGSGPILVGMDDSDGARAALDWAVAEAARLGATLRVVHGWEPLLTAPEQRPVFDPADAPDLVRDVERWYREAARAAMGHLGVDVPLEVEVAGAAATEALVEESEQAALVVVGSRGRGGFTGLLLGSVSQKVLHQSACPVAVVPHDRRR